MGVVVSISTMRDELPGFATISIGTFAFTVNLCHSVPTDLNVTVPGDGDSDAVEEDGVCVAVGVRVGVLVAVDPGLGVFVAVGVCVGVLVRVGVAVGGSPSPTVILYVRTKWGTLAASNQMISSVVLPSSQPARYTSSPSSAHRALPPRSACPRSVHDANPSSSLFVAIIRKVGYRSS